MTTIVSSPYPSATWALRAICARLVRAVRNRSLRKLSDRQLRDAGIDLADVRTKAAAGQPTILTYLLSLR
jgi:uncharacterized protein YjiS (DUF1127 family)